MCLDTVTKRFEPPKFEEAMAFKMVLQKDGLTYAPFRKNALRTDVWIAETRQGGLGEGANIYRPGFHVCESEKEAESLAACCRKHRNPEQAIGGWKLVVVPVMIREIVAEGYQYGFKVLIARQMFCFRAMPVFENFRVDDWDELVAA